MRKNPQTCHFLQGGRERAKTNSQVQAIASLCYSQITLRVTYIKTIKIVSHAIKFVLVKMMFYLTFTYVCFFVFVDAKTKYHFTTAERPESFD